MSQTKPDKKLVAYCGLYCGSCGKYQGGSCPGCHANEKASWCQVRRCCAEHRYGSCADCKEFDDPMRCGKFNNLMSKLFGLLFNSNRAACIAAIRSMGPERYAGTMAAQGRQTLPRWGR